MSNPKSFMIFTAFGSVRPFLSSIDSDYEAISFEWLSSQQRLEIVAGAATDSAIENSAIEGEVLNPASVYSSLVRRLGLEAARIQDDRTGGVVSMTLDAIRLQQHAKTDLKYMAIANTPRATAQREQRAQHRMYYCFDGALRKGAKNV